eukprot:TRINITY_DN5355_c0_g1_i7.p1 TRINITY_DN5355_c0_g1~~TRINITY_DN5355_c0_g1_i7.p1  ORF type:complete len:262 (-),score=-3.24 TRINITY_DN5355_c0_g1_i7:59-844(-)
MTFNIMHGKFSKNQFANQSVQIFKIKAGILVVKIQVHSEPLCLHTQSLATAQQFHELCHKELKQRTPKKSQNVPFQCSQKFKKLTIYQLNLSSSSLNLINFAQKWRIQHKNYLIKFISVVLPLQSGTSSIRKMAYQKIPLKCGNFYHSIFLQKITNQLQKQCSQVLFQLHLGWLRFSFHTSISIMKINRSKFIPDFAKKYLQQLTKMIGNKVKPFNAHLIIIVKKIVTTSEQDKGLIYQGVEQVDKRQRYNKYIDLLMIYC